MFSLPGKLWRDDKKDWSDDVRQKLRARQKKIAAYLLLKFFEVINFNPAAVNSPDFLYRVGGGVPQQHIGVNLMINIYERDFERLSSPLNV